MFGVSLMLVEQLLQALPEEEGGRAPLNKIHSDLQKVLPRSSISLLGRGDNEDLNLEFISQQQLASTFQTEEITFNKNHIQKC